MKAEIKGYFYLVHSPNKEKVAKQRKVDFKSIEQLDAIEPLVVSLNEMGDDDSFYFVDEAYIEGRVDGKYHEFSHPGAQYLVGDTNWINKFTFSRLRREIEKMMEGALK